MEVSGYLIPAGGANLQKYQIGEAMADPGVPVEIPTLANVDGVLLVETTTAILGIGVTHEAAATRNTAQQSDGSDPQALVTVDIRPDALIKARCSGGSSSGTVLSEFTETAGSSDGLTITAAIGAGYDDGYAIGATGANAGVWRKITAVDGSTATAVIAFPRDIAVGDTFYAFTFGPSEDAGVTLTSDLTEVDATADGQANDNFRCVRMEWRSKGKRGARETYAYLAWFDHLYGFCSPST